MQKTSLISIILSFILIASPSFAYTQNWISTLGFGDYVTYGDVFYTAGGTFDNITIDNIVAPSWPVTWTSSYLWQSSFMGRKGVYKYVTNGSATSANPITEVIAGSWNFSYINANASIGVYFSNATGFSDGSFQLLIKDMTTSTDVYSTAIHNTTGWQDINYYGVNLTSGHYYRLALYPTTTIALTSGTIIGIDYMKLESGETNPSISLYEPIGCSYQSDRMYFWPFKNSSEPYYRYTTSDPLKTIKTKISDWNDVKEVWIKSANTDDWNVWKASENGLYVWKNASMNGDIFKIVTYSGQGYTLSDCASLSCDNLYRPNVYYSWPYENTSIPSGVSSYIPAFSSVNQIVSYNGTSQLHYLPTASYQNLFYLIKGQPFAIGTISNTNVTLLNYECMPTDAKLGNGTGTFCLKSYYNSNRRGYATYFSGTNNTLYGECPSGTLCVGYTTTTSGLNSTPLADTNSITCLNMTTLKISSSCVDELGVNVECTSICQSTNCTSWGNRLPTDFCANETSVCYVSTTSGCQVVECAVTPENSFAGETALYIAGFFGVSSLSLAENIFAILISLIIGFVALFLTKDSQHSAIAFVIGTISVLCGFTLMLWFPSWVFIVLLVISAYLIAQSMKLGGN